MMAAALTPSLLLLLVHSLTADQDLGGPGPSDSGGPETCKSPVTIWSSLTVSPSKLWYDRGERLQVMCSEGYRPSTSVIECRQQGQSSASEWNVTVTCIQRCKNPNTGWSVLILAPSKEWYDRGERVQVACAAGYKPSTSTFECRQRLWGSASEWDVTPSCIQKCQKPIIGGSALRFSPSKEWYDRGEWVYVTCVEGYQTLTPSILCREKDVSSLSEWNETPTCIEIKRTRLGVSSSSVTLTLTCGNDDCRSFWETSATWYQNSCCANRCPPHVLYQECAIEAQDNRTKETAVTCAGLLPVTEYIVAVYGVRKQPSPDRHYLLYNVTVTTNETVPDAPEIEWFNATTKTIKWKELSECSGTIQEYQLNITAWSDYNKTFLETEFVTVNSSVTEYTVERYDTNYKARIRGLTSAGLGKALTWTFTTKISGSSNEDQQPVAQEESLEPSLSSMDEVSVSPMDESGATPVILAKEEKVRGYPNHVKAFQDIQKSIHTIQERLEKKMDSLVGVINVLNQNVIQVIGSQQNLTRDLSTALSRFTDVLKDSQLISSNSGLFSKKATGPLPTASTNTVEQKGGSEDAQ